MELINNFCEFRDKKAYIKQGLDCYTYDNIYTLNKQTIEQINILKKVSQTDVTVMICGETGTGKELFADFLHNNSRRKEKVFIKLNCATILDNLFESEMFGYESGTFTGAAKTGKKGVFELSNNGTLFLDEVGEMPYDTQSKLLRVIQERNFYRLGGSKEIHIDVRLVVATNRNLNEEMDNGKFRKDLFYRFNVITVNLIPLRQRKEDIILLSIKFMEHFSQKYGYQKHLSYSAINKLISYDWPGNIRELKNSIERTVLLSANEIITEDDIIVENYNISEAPKEYEAEINILPHAGSKSLAEYVSDFEIKLINKYMEEYGSLRKAAKELKTSAATLSRKLNIKLDD